MKRLALAALLAVGAAARAATVRMNESGQVRGARVTVGEVAAVESPSAADVARMSAVVVAYVEKGAEAAEIRAETVRSALAGAGFNLGEILITGAACARVSRKDAGAPALRRVSEAIQNHLEGAAPGARFEISGLELDFQPAEGFSPVVRALRPGPASGPVRFDIADATAPRAVKGHAFATLAKSVRAVTAARRVLGGHRISPEDIQTAWVSEGSAEGCCRSAADVLGRRVLFKLSPGAPIPDCAIEREEAVKRGDQVTLEVEAKSMTISMKTVALESGALGDVVRLRRIGGRGECLGKVIGPGRAAPLEGGAK